MYPNQPGQYPPPQTTHATRSLDYLDQISGTSNVKRGPSGRILIAAMVAAILSIILFFVLATRAQPSSTEKLTLLYARLQTIQSITTTEQKEVADTGLRTANSNLSLLLSGTIRDLKDMLATGKTSSVVLPKTVQASEKAYSKDLLDKFTQAKLYVTFDSTYAREMSYQLSLLQTAMKSLYPKAGPNLKKTLQSASDNLAPIQQKFTDFSGSKE